MPPRRQIQRKRGARRGRGRKGVCVSEELTEVAESSPSINAEELMEVAEQSPAVKAEELTEGAEEMPSINAENLNESSQEHTESVKLVEPKADLEVSIDVKEEESDSSEGVGKLELTLDDEPPELLDSRVNNDSSKSKDDATGIEGLGDDVQILDSTEKCYEKNPVPDLEEFDANLSAGFNADLAETFEENLAQLNAELASDLEANMEDNVNQKLLSDFELNLAKFNDSINSIDDDNVVLEEANIEEELEENEDNIEDYEEEEEEYEELEDQEGEGENEIDEEKVDIDPLPGGNDENLEELENCEDENAEYDETYEECDEYDGEYEETEDNPENNETEVLGDKEADLKTLENKGDDPETLEDKGDNPETLEDKEDDPEALDDKGDDPEILADKGDDPETLADEGDDPAGEKIKETVEETHVANASCSEKNDSIKGDSKVTALENTEKDSTGTLTTDQEEEHKCDDIVAIGHSEECLDESKKELLENISSDISVEEKKKDNKGEEHANSNDKEEPVVGAADELEDLSEGEMEDLEGDVELEEVTDGEMEDIADGPADDLEDLSDAEMEFVEDVGDAGLEDISLDSNDELNMTSEKNADLEPLPGVKNGSWEDVDELVLSEEWQIMDETDGDKSVSDFPRPVYKKPFIRGIQHGTPAIIDMLRKIKEPLIGLEHMVEIWKEDGQAAPRYYCDLCRYLIPIEDFSRHLFHIFHKLEYLKTHAPEYWRKFPSSDTITRWDPKYKKALNCAIDLLVKQNTLKYTVLVTSKTWYSFRKREIRQRVAGLPHFRFRTGSFRKVFHEIEEVKRNEDKGKQSEHKRTTRESSRSERSRSSSKIKEESNRSQSRSKVDQKKESLSKKTSTNTKSSGPSSNSAKRDKTSTDVSTASPLRVSARLQGKRENKEVSQPLETTGSNPSDVNLKKVVIKIEALPEEVPDNTEDEIAKADIVDVQDENLPVEVEVSEEKEKTEDVKELPTSQSVENPETDIADNNTPLEEAISTDNLTSNANDTNEPSEKPVVKYCSKRQTARKSFPNKRPPLISNVPLKSISKESENEKITDESATVEPVSVVAEKENQISEKKPDTLEAAIETKDMPVDEGIKAEDSNKVDKEVDKDIDLEIIEIKDIIAEANLIKSGVTLKSTKRPSGPLGRRLPTRRFIRGSSDVKRSSDTIDKRRSSASAKSTGSNETHKTEQTSKPSSVKDSPGTDNKKASTRSDNNERERKSEGASTSKSSRVIRREDRRETDNVKRARLDPDKTEPNRSTDKSTWRNDQPKRNISPKSTTDSKRRYSPARTSVRQRVNPSRKSPVRKRYSPPPRSPVRRRSADRSRDRYRSRTRSRSRDRRYRSPSPKRRRSRSTSRSDSRSYSPYSRNYSPTRRYINKRAFSPKRNRSPLRHHYDRKSPLSNRRRSRSPESKFIRKRSPLPYVREGGLIVFDNTMIDANVQDMGKHHQSELMANPSNLGSQFGMFGESGTNAGLEGNFNQSRGLYASTLKSKASQAQKDIRNVQRVGNYGGISSIISYDDPFEVIQSKLDTYGTNNNTTAKGVRKPGAKNQNFWENWHQTHQEEPEPDPIAGNFIRQDIWTGQTGSQQQWPPKVPDNSITDWNLENSLRNMERRKVDEFNDESAFMKQSRGGISVTVFNKGEKPSLKPSMKAERSFIKPNLNKEQGSLNKWGNPPNPMDILDSFSHEKTSDRMEWMKNPTSTRKSISSTSKLDFSLPKKSFAEEMGKREYRDVTNLEVHVTNQNLAAAVEDNWKHLGKGPSGNVAMGSSGGGGKEALESKMSHWNPESRSQQMFGDGWPDTDELSRSSGIRGQNRGFQDRAAERENWRKNPSSNFSIGGSGGLGNMDNISSSFLSSGNEPSWRSSGAASSNVSGGSTGNLGNFGIGNSRNMGGVTAERQLGSTFAMGGPKSAVPGVSNLPAGQLLQQHQQLLQQQQMWRAQSQLLESQAQKQRMAAPALSVQQPPPEELDSVAQKLNMTLTRILNNYKPTGGLFSTPGMKSLNRGGPQSGAQGGYNAQGSGDKLSLAQNIAAALTSIGMANIPQHQLIAILQHLGLLRGGNQGMMNQSRVMEDLRATVSRFERTFQNHRF